VAGYGTHNRDLKQWMVTLLSALSLMMVVVTIGLLALFLVFGKGQL
jgi:transmembrane serine protease 11A